MQSLGRAPQRPQHIRRDPAPSRWQYRMQRLWLTPLFRVLFRVGLPVASVGLVAALVLHDDSRRAALVQTYDSLREQFQDRPEFRVSYLSIEGASRDLADAVRAKLAVKLPESSFDLDLDALRQKAEALDAVAKAELRVRSGGVLQVVLTERTPVLVWRTETGLELLDATGHRVAGLAERGDRSDLPLVAGEGADTHAAEALELLGAAGPISPRIRGLVRMGDRRWDIVLDREQRILLPPDGAVAALERLLALDAAENLLARDLAAVDLRNEQRPVLRLAPFALAEARRALGIIETTESDL
jgi:cell division protein FtsQ